MPRQGVVLYRIFYSTGHLFWQERERGENVFFYICPYPPSRTHGNKKPNPPSTPLSERGTPPPAETTGQYCRYPLYSKKAPMISVQSLPETFRFFVITRIFSLKFPCFPVDMALFCPLFSFLGNLFALADPQVPRQHSLQQPSHISPAKRESDHVFHKHRRRQLEFFRRQQ